MADRTSLGWRKRGLVFQPDGQGGWMNSHWCGASRKARWLTLPLEKAPQDMLIRDLRFPANAADLLIERLQRGPPRNARPIGLRAFPSGDGRSLMPAR